MKRAAFYSKSSQAKADFVQSFIEGCGKSIVIYLYPKNRKDLIKPQVSASVHYFTYEDMTKTDQWLCIHSLLGDNTALVLDNPSRYPKITSTKVLALIRLEKMVDAKCLVDIAPFTLDIQYLFQPISYLGRDILGYAHYYAWRENYHEVDSAGNVRKSHDFDLVANKIKSVASIDYPFFLCRDRQMIEFSSTQSEMQSYAALKDELFSAKDFTPQPAITKLADFAHAFQSRYDALLDLLSVLMGSTLIYTNLSSYAAKVGAIAKKAGFKNVKATSYQVGSTEQFDNVIYLESPIIKSYLLLDAEAKLQEGCKVFHIVGDTKVDRYLYGQLDHELNQIDGFTKELYSASHRKAIPQALPTKDRFTGSAGTHQLDLFQLQNC